MNWKDRSIEAIKLSAFVRQTGLILLLAFVSNLSFGYGAVTPDDIPPPPPSNDDLCDAIPLTVGAPCAGYIYTIEDATTETDEGDCSDPLSNSVWFSFVPPESGMVYVTTSREFPGSISLSRKVYYEEGVFDCLDMTTIGGSICYDDDDWTDTLAVCGLSDSDTYWIQVYGAAVVSESDFCIEVFEDLPDAGPDQELCDQTSTTLAGSQEIYYPHEWEVISGTATIESSDWNSNVTGLVVGSSVTIRRVIYCGEAIVSADTMTITNYFDTDVPLAGDDQILCNETTTMLLGNSPDFGTEMWTVISGTAVISDPLIPQPDVTGLLIGATAFFEYKFTNGVCVKRDTMSITVDAPSEEANAGPDQLLCDETTTLLEANSPMSGVGLWTVLGGPADVDDPSDPNSLVTDLGFSPTTNTLEWSITDGDCISRDTVEITYAAVIDADAGPDQYLCEETMGTLDGNSPIEGDFGYWALLSGTATIVDDGDPNTDITGLIPQDTIMLEWYISNEYCTTYDTVIIYNAAMPIADAGSSIGLCEITNTTLDATPPSFGMGTWSLGGGVGTIVDPSAPNSDVIDLDPGFSYAWFNWTVVNGACMDEDFVGVTVDEKPFVDAGSDQEICDETFSVLDGNEPQDFGKSFESGLWTIISGSATITDPTVYNSGITDLIPGTIVELVWTITSEANICTASDTMTITVYELPTTADAGPDQVLCSTETMTTLEGNMPIAGTGMWTLLDGIATISDPGSPSTTLTDIDPSVTLILRWTISSGNCPSSMDDVIITFDEAPSSADAGPNQELCDQTMTTLEGNTPIVGSGEWSVNFGTATITDPFSPTSDVTGLNLGELVSLQWTISNGVCPSSSDEVSIISFELPTTSEAGPDQELCNVTSTFLDANSPLVGQGIWSLVSGVADISNPESPTTEITGLVLGGSVVLEWTIANGACPASVDQVTISVDELPTIADAGPDQELCNVTSTIMNANAPLVGTGVWTVINGSATIADPGSPTTEITGLTLDASVTLQWAVDNGICPVSADEVTVTVFNLPTESFAGEDQQLCNVTETVLEANEPFVGSGAWFVVSGQGEILNPETPVTTVFDLVPGSTAVFEWVISNGVCPSSSDEVMVTIDALPSNANAGPDQYLCDVLSTFLDAQTPEVGDGLWSVVEGDGLVVSPSDPQSELIDLVYGTTVTLQWEISNGVCPTSTDHLIIDVEELPTEANAGEDQNLCGPTSTFLEGNAPVVGDGYWIKISGPGLIVNPELPNSEIINLEYGMPTVCQWTIFGVNCPSGSDEVTIITAPGEVESDAGPDQEICNETSVFMNGNLPMGAIGEWMVIMGTATIIDPTDPNTEVTGFNQGETVVMQWALTPEGCSPSLDQMNILVNSSGFVDAGPDQFLCEEVSTILSGNTPDSGEGVWTVVSGSANIESPNDPNAVVSDLELNTTVLLEWMITDGDCLPSKDTVEITTSSMPDMAIAGDDQTLCNSTMTNLNASMPIIGTGEWTLISGFGVIDDPLSPTTAVTGLVIGGTATFEWAVANGECPESTDQVTITVDSPPSQSLAGDDQFLCVENETTLAANTPVMGVGKWISVSGSGDIEDIMSPVSQITNLVYGSDVTLVWQITNGICPPSNDTMMILWHAMPGPALAGDNQYLCLESSTVLEAVEPLTGTGMWTIIEGVGVVADANSPTSIITGLIENDSVTLEWTVSNASCLPVTDQITIYVDIPPSPAMAGSDIVHCDETSVSLDAMQPTVGDGHWTIFNGPGTLVNPNDPKSELTGLIPGETTYLQWSVTNGACPGDNDTISVQVDQSPSQAIAGEDQVVCGEASTMLNAEIPVTGQGGWSIESGTATLSDPSAPDALLTDLVSGSSVVLKWTVSHGSCPSTADEIIIMIDEEPTEALAGDDQVLCDQTTTLLDGNMPVIGVGQWNIISGSGVVNEPGNPASAVSNLVYGDPLMIEWGIKEGFCESTDTVIITADEMPEAAIAGDDQVICGSETFLDGNVPMTGTGSWLILSGSGILQDSSDPASLLSAIVPGGTVELQWTIANACGETFDTVTVMANSELPVANAGDDQILCNSLSSVLSALPANTGDGVWSVLTGTGIIADINSPNSMITGLTPGSSTVVQWMVQDDPCPPAFDTLVIWVDELPGPVYAGIDDIICDTNYVLSAELPVTGTGTWNIESGVGMIVDAANPQAELSGLIRGRDVVLTWNVANGVCPVVSDTITITTTLPLTVPDAGDDEVFCNLPLITLNGNTPGPEMGTGTWSLVSGQGTIEDVNNPFSVVTAPGVGNNVFAWTISNGVCTPLHDTVIITNTGQQGPNANFLVSEVGCVDTLMYMFDISENDVRPTGYLWDFGDGSTSTERDPVHRYETAGSFTITLTTFLDDCASIPVTKEVNVFACLFEEPPQYGSRQIQLANVFPNPTDDVFKVSLKLKEENDVELLLYNAKGQVVDHRRLEQVKEVLTSLHPDMPGVYFVRIKVKDEVIVFKAIRIN